MLLMPPTVLSISSSAVRVVVLALDGGIRPSVVSGHATQLFTVSTVPPESKERYRTCAKLMNRKNTLPVLEVVQRLGR